MQILTRDFFDRDTPEVAQDVLGALLVHEYKGNRLVVMISETEAYCNTDAACHAYRGKTPRNVSLFGPVGHAYTYISYGIHTCFNIVSYNTRTMHAGGVLIRSIVPVEGREIMLVLRNHHKNIGNGPGNVTRAMGITMNDNGVDLTTGGDLYVAVGQKPKHIKTTPRIGITKNAEAPWRFYIDE